MIQEVARERKRGEVKPFLAGIFGGSLACSCLGALQTIQRKMGGKVKDGEYSACHKLALVSVSRSGGAGGTAGKNRKRHCSPLLGPIAGRNILFWIINRFADGTVGR